MRTDEDEWKVSIHGSMDKHNNQKKLECSSELECNSINIHQY